MQLEEILRTTNENIDSKDWQFALRNIYVNFVVDAKSLDCIEIYPCVFSKETITKSKQITPISGYIIGTTSGILVFCLRVNDFPVNAFIDKKTIRVVEAESKLFGAYVRIKTNDEVFIFKVDKKILSNVEKMVNKVKNN